MALLYLPSLDSQPRMASLSPPRAATWLGVQAEEFFFSLFLNPNPPAAMSMIHRFQSSAASLCDLLHGATPDGALGQSLLGLPEFDELVRLVRRFRPDRRPSLTGPPTLPQATWLLAARQHAATLRSGPAANTRGRRQSSIPAPPPRNAAGPPTSRRPRAGQPPLAQMPCMRKPAPKAVASPPRPKTPGRRRESILEQPPRRRSTRLKPDTTTTPSASHPPGEAPRADATDACAGEAEPPPAVDVEPQPLPSAATAAEPAAAEVGDGGDGGDGPEEQASEERAQAAAEPPLAPTTPLVAEEEAAHEGAPPPSAAHPAAAPHTTPAGGGGGEGGGGGGGGGGRRSMDTPTMETSPPRSTRRLAVGGRRGAGGVGDTPLAAPLSSASSESTPNLGSPQLQPESWRGVHSRRRA